MKTKQKETYNGLMLLGTIVTLIPLYLELFNVINKPEAMLMAGIGTLIFCSSVILNK